ncbi:hypothetical protein I5M32_11205 [Pedobacter sp. SD-b]|uniref:SGNH hydrolase-type esterase domain-containing protein n=1 Tax=Pedobacter segetis TaxID=2793069 RepID=A0ABS1BKV4_9SPHI|nr:GDSL-type esterase/lipase family protein [Pedobacter segetis]MBK0383524.1 hypothetical protein [Pedobacter segetis]
MKRVNDTLYDIIDSHTGENFNYSKVTTYADGSPMNDAKCDGVIYRKLGNEYFKKNIGSLNAVKSNAGGLIKSDDKPSVFKDACSIKRTESGFPYNGLVLTFRQPDGVLLQFNSPFNKQTTGLAYRIANGNSDDPDTVFSEWIYLHDDFLNTESYKRINTIIAFGDSITYGYGLATPEKDSWPAQLAQQLQLGLFNKAVSGSGCMVAFKQFKNTFIYPPYDNLTFLQIGFNDVRYSGSAPLTLYNSELIVNKLMGCISSMLAWSFLKYGMDAANSSGNDYSGLISRSITGTWQPFNPTDYTELSFSAKMPDAVRNGFPNGQPIYSNSPTSEIYFNITPYEEVAVLNYFLTNSPEKEGNFSVFVNNVLYKTIDTYVTDAIKADNDPDLNYSIVPCSLLIKLPKQTGNEIKIVLNSGSIRLDYFGVLKSSLETNMPFFVGSIPYMPDFFYISDQTNKLIQNYASLRILNLCQEFKDLNLPVFFVNVNNSYDANDSSQVLGDNIHPTAKGARNIKKLYEEYVKKYFKT